MNKRAIAILGAIFILIIGTLGFLIYQRSRNNIETPTTPIVPVAEEPTVPEEPAPPAEPEPTGRAVKLSDDAIVSPILFYQGNGISYFSNTGQLFQTDLQITDSSVLLSNKRELSIALKSGINRILWPQAGNSFIAELGGTQKTWSYYNSDQGNYVDIPSKVYSLDWMPSGDKIMYVWVDNGKAELSIANPDTTAHQTLTDFYALDNTIDVSPDGRNILFYRNQTSDLAKNTINLVTSDGKSFRGIVNEGYNRGVLWSPDSKRFLFTKRNPSTSKFELWMGDISTGEIRSLGLTTSEQKAVWTKDGQTVYIAVPTTGTAGQGLTQDTIYRFSVSTFDKTEIQPGVAVDAQELFLSSSENVLFFRNAQDNALYYMNL